MISKTFYVAAMSVRAGRTCPSDVCHRLPSDPVSRRTPLPLAVSFPQSGRFGDLRPLVCVRAGRTLINPASGGAGGKVVILIPLRHARVGRTNLWADWPHRAPEITAGEAPTDFIVRSAAYGPSAVAGRIERTRHDCTKIACFFELGTTAPAGGRQEDGVAVRTVYLIAVHAVLCDPEPCAVV